MSRVANPALLVVASVLFCACGSLTPPPSEPTGPIQPSGVYGLPNSTSGGSSADAPEISRSAGPEGGIVVLWPRIVLPHGSAGPDPETRQLAGRLQSHLADLSKRAAGNRPVDVRPEPERVCPRNGCQATAVGALLARAGRGCAVVILASPPGRSAAELVPYRGQMQLKAASVPFREPPENFVSVTDYAPCDQLLTEGPSDADVAAAIERAAGGATH